MVRRWENVWTSGRRDRRAAWQRALVRVATTTAAAAGALSVVVPSAVAQNAWEPGIRPVWTKDAGAQVVSLEDPDVVVGVRSDRRGTVVEAAHASDGRRAWSTRLPAPRPDGSFFDPEERLTAADGLVVVAGYEGLRTLDARTGRLLWDVPAAAAVRDDDEPEALIGTDAVYAAASDGSTTVVRRHDRRTGAESWRRSSPGRRLVDAGAHLVTGDACRWQVLTKATGALVRTGTGRAGCYGGGDTPTVDDGLMADHGTSDPVLRRVVDGSSVATLDGDGVGVVVGASRGTWLVERGGALVVHDADGTVLWDDAAPPETMRRSRSIRGDLLVESDQRDSSALLRALPTLVRFRDLRTGAVLGTFLPAGELHAVGRGTGAVALFGNNGTTTVVAPGAVGAQIGRTPPPEGSWDLDVVFAGPPSRTRAATVRVPVEAPVGEQATCRVDDGPWEPCAGTWTTPELAEGERVIEARAGTTSPVRRLIDVDRTPPLARFTRHPDPVVSIREGSSRVQYDADEPAASFECRQDDRSWTSCERGFGGGPSPSGTHRIDVRATDRAGNIGPVASTTWREDQDSPRIDVRRPPERVDGYETAIDFDASDGQGGVRSHCQLREPDEFRGRVLTEGPCTSPWTVAAPGPGHYVVRVTSTDEAGNPSSGSTDVTFLARRDLVPGFVATPTRGDNSAADYWGTGLRFETTRHGVGGLAVRNECRLRAEDEIGAGPWKDCGYGLVPGFDDGPRDGRWVLQVRAADEVGRTGPTVERAFGLDREGPALRLVGGQEDPVAPGTQIALPRLEVEEPRPHESPVVGSTCDVFVDSARVPEAACGGTVAMGRRNAGVTATARDETGNTTTIFRSVPAVVPPTDPPANDPPLTDPPLTDPPVTDPPVTDPPTTSGPPGTPGPGPTGPRAPGPGAADALAALLAGLRPPTATSPAPPPSADGADRSCSPAPARGPRPPSVRSARRSGTRVVVVVRSPGASRAAPSRVLVQGRTACGRWRTLGRATSRSATVRLRTTRVTWRVDGVRVRATRRGITSHSAVRTVG